MKAKRPPRRQAAGVYVTLRSARYRQAGTLVFIRDGQPEFWSDRPLKFESHIRLLLGEYRVARGGRPVDVKFTDIKWKQLGSSTWWRIPAWPDGEATVSS